MESEVRELHLRAMSLVSKFEEGEGSGYIHEAIKFDREALELCPPSHSKRPLSLVQLACHLNDRYRQLGRTRDLEEAITLEREALELLPQEGPGRLISLNNLAISLVTRFHQLGTMQDLDEVIVLQQEALDFCPQGHPDRLMTLNNLALSLRTRYSQLGAMQDLDKAIVLHRQALDLCPQGHPDRPMCLNNFATCLSIRHRESGKMQDLNESIVLIREGLKLLPQGHPRRSTSLGNLAICLFNRFDRLGAIQDLDEAIVLSREALNLCPQGHSERSVSLHSLALVLFIRCSHLGTMQDLDEAIFLYRQALELQPQGHIDRSMTLNNFSRSLYTRYNKLKEIQDLDEAIVLVRESLELYPQGHSQRPGSLNSLGLYLSARYKQLETMQDLDEAIALGREALGLTSQGHHDRSLMSVNLAQHLADRSMFSAEFPVEDWEEAFSLYSQLADITEVVSSVDLSATRTWTRMAEFFEHSTLLLAYETSLRLLAQHLATLPSLPQHLAIFKDLTSSLAVDAFSACLRKGFPTRAVELLEQGRGVFWSQLTRLRSPLEDVSACGPAGKELGDEFSRLVSLIRNTLNSPDGDQHERVCGLNLELQKVVTSIRELPGHSCFLLPSLFSDLQHAATNGPVIIVNASKYGCDALVVLLHQDPVHIPLQVTQEIVRDLSTELRTLAKRATRDNVTRELAFFLRKLWDQIASPIVEFLQTILPSQSRIWWCPTADFSVLPLHAAGPYRKGQRNLPDLYISSYTPTMAALIHARRRDPSNAAAQEKHFIAIGQAKAAGESELFSVDAELDRIGQQISSIATFTRIDGKDSSISRVAEELGKNEWVHLACHGLPNPAQPFESAFALRDGHFTIQRIIGCSLTNPEFAYLSACHTTVGDKDTPDEVIHLASAMQFAGFCSVIGTMWAVDDGATNKITSTFYKHIVNESGQLDYTRAAFALNQTMKSVNIPFDQRILYIHIGA